MAPRKIDVAASKPEMEKNLKVRVDAKRVRAEMGKIREDQESLRAEQSKIITRFGEIARQCDELKEETEMIVKETAMTQNKLVLMFRILKAREGGDFVHAANLTRFLREIVAMEKANAILAGVKNEDPKTTP